MAMLRCIPVRSFLCLCLGLLIFSSQSAGFRQADAEPAAIPAEITQGLEVIQTWHDTPIVSATQTPSPPLTPTPTLKPPLNEINDWHYQLQNVSLVQLRDCAYDLLVMDYSDDSGTEYTVGQITGLSTPSNPKKVLAYLSIGQAENYRSYWRPFWTTGNPVFLDEENENSPGNFSVLYWLPGWKDIIVSGASSYLQEILKAGFDGVYLDTVDEYVFFEQKVQRDAVFGSLYGTVDFRQEMVLLVQQIAQVARSYNPNFLVLAQNGLELWHQEGYAETLDGVAAEEVYFAATNRRRPIEETKRDEGYLRLFRQSGHLVLTVDYIDADKVLEIAEAYQRSSSPENDFVPFATDPGLDVFRINVGQEPD